MSIVYPARLGVALLGLVLLAACSPSADSTARPAVDEGEITVAGVLASPREHYGQTVTVQGIFGETLIPSWAFTIRESHALGDEVLVIVREPTGLTEHPDNHGTGNPYPNPDGPTSPSYRQAVGFLEVTGVLRAFDIEEFEREIGVSLRDTAPRLPDADLEDWQGRPAILADLVDVAAGE